MLSLLQLRLPVHVYYYLICKQVMGSCFLSFLETQSKLLTSVAEIMSPLGAYKELGKGLNDSLSNSVVKEATVGWLAAAQVCASKKGWRVGE